jgi:predicted component of type VI protein secretion system
MNEFEIRNRLHELRGYISSEYFNPKQAKALYSEEEKLEKILRDFAEQKKAQDGSSE